MNQIIGRASGPIILGPVVDVYPMVLIGHGAGPKCWLNVQQGVLNDGYALLWPTGQEAFSRDLVRQIEEIRDAYRRSNAK